jgi:hypothetical protein
MMTWFEPVVETRSEHAGIPLVNRTPSADPSRTPIPNDPKSTVRNPPRSASPRPARRRSRRRSRRPDEVDEDRRDRFAIGHDVEVHQAARRSAIQRRRPLCIVPVSVAEQDVGGRSSAPGPRRVHHGLVERQRHQRELGFDLMATLISGIRASSTPSPHHRDHGGRRPSRRNPRLTRPGGR